MYLRQVARVLNYHSRLCSVAGHDPTSGEPTRASRVLNRPATRLTRPYRKHFQRDWRKSTRTRSPYGVHHGFRAFSCLRTSWPRRAPGSVARVHTGLTHVATTARSTGKSFYPHRLGCTWCRAVVRSAGTVWNRRLGRHSGRVSRFYWNKAGTPPGPIVGWALGSGILLSLFRARAVADPG